MRKLIIFIIITIMFIPTINVNANGCSANIVSTDKNFTCDKVGNIRIFYNTSEFSKFFEVKKIDETKSRIYITDMNGLMTNIPSNVKVAKLDIKIGDEVIGNINVTNSKYVEPTTQPTTTEPTTTAPTTTAPTTTKTDLPTYTVTLDHNNETGEKTQKACTVSSSSNACSITLPKLDDENFNGWGTAKTCKEGSGGNIRVTENTTYYACYKNQTEQVDIPMLESLKLYNEETSEELNFGVFSIKNNTYKLTVENNVKNIKVDAIAAENVKVEIIGNTDLLDGVNEIVINLKDESDKENSYVIEVTKLKEGETIDRNHYLSNLTIGGYSISFDKKTFNYILPIEKDIQELIINYELENSSDKVTINGNKNLINGSIITVEVTGDNDVVTKYFINITKEEINNNIIYFVIGGILLVIIILILIIFIRNDRNKKTSSSRGNSVEPKKKKEKKSKKKKNEPAILPDSKEEIEILNF